MKKIIFLALISTLIFGCKATSRQSDLDSKSSIYKSVKEGDNQLLLNLISNGEDVNQEQDGVPLLFVACQNGNLKIVKILIEHGADVNKSEKSSDSTSILTAAQHGYLKIVELLIEHGADVNKVNSYGATPLILASDRGHIEMVKVLLKAGAQVNLAGSRNRTSLFFAIEQANQELIELLIDKGANVNHIDNIGYAPLDIANKISCVSVDNEKDKKEYIKCKNHVNNITKFLIKKAAKIGPRTKEREDNQKGIKKNSKYDIRAKNYIETIDDNRNDNGYSCSWQLNCHDRLSGVGVIDPKSIYKYKDYQKIQGTPSSLEQQTKHFTIYDSKN
jgi:ankyrin repeat protein